MVLVCLSNVAAFHRCAKGCAEVRRERKEMRKVKVCGEEPKKKEPTYPPCLERAA
jgi:hypothetical protein